MIVGLLVVILFLVAVASLEVPTAGLGRFERERRKKDGSLEVERELAHDDIVSLKHILEALLLVAAAAVSVATFGWLFGLIIAALIALEYGGVARAKFIRRQVSKLYARIESALLRMVLKYASVLKYIRIFSPETPELTLHSRAELTHVIEEAKHNVVSPEEKKRILHSLDFPQKIVREIMTPRSMIDAVNKTELLGPLVLDDLHKKGHSRFPVIENDVDHVVGILHLRDLLQLNTARKHTAKVETAMEPRVYFINENQSLDHALNAFIKTHHHLFVVVNEYRETVGLLSLEDVIEALLGRKIVDEFDTHDDLRAVAARSPRVNGSAKHATDV